MVVGTARPYRAKSLVRHCRKGTGADGPGVEIPEGQMKEFRFYSGSKGESVPEDLLHVSFHTKVARCGFALSRTSPFR